MTDVGERRWVIAGGRIPPASTGDEPEHTSRDELSILNCGDGEARIELTVFHADRDPVGPYSVEVGARRVRCVRVNDLIDPEAVPLGRDYAILVDASAPVVVQHFRLDSRRAENAIATSLGFPVPARGG